MITLNENAPILVEFPTLPGVQKVSLKPEDLVEKSTKAMESAMNAIHNMAMMVVAAVGGIVKGPNQVEISFGLKLDAEAGAFIAKAGTEASINVKLTWQPK